VLYPEDSMFLTDVSNVMYTCHVMYISSHHFLTWTSINENYVNMIYICNICNIYRVALLLHTFTFLNWELLLINVVIKISSYVICQNFKFWLSTKIFKKANILKCVPTHRHRPWFNWIVEIFYVLERIDELNANKAELWQNINLCTYK
jgi:hypothetical protein